MIYCISLIFFILFFLTYIYYLSYLVIYLAILVDELISSFATEKPSLGSGNKVCMYVCMYVWYNEVENNTTCKYYLSLEKQHYKQSTISQINVSDHTFVTLDKDILTDCTSFITSFMNPKAWQANHLTCWFSLTALMIQPLKSLKQQLRRTAY